MGASQSSQLDTGEDERQRALAAEYQAKLEAKQAQAMQIRSLEAQVPE